MNEMILIDSNEIKRVCFSIEKLLIKETLSKGQLRELI